MTTTTERKRAPQPEMIGRRDHEHGRWTVGDSPAARGIPHTDIHNRKMVAPHGADDLDRVIRGHEMMHAKVSPTPGEMMAWIGREVATQGSLIAVEEARVNTLCTRVGIPVDKYLTDGSEKNAGKKLADAGDITGLVHGAVACAGTVGGKEFIKGVRSSNKNLAKLMASIQKEVMKNLNGVHQSVLAAVADGDVPGGFAQVERIAEWVDRLIEKMEEERKEQDRRDKEDSRSSDDTEDGEEDESSEDSDTDKKGSESATKKPRTKKPSPKRDLTDPTKHSRPDRGTIPAWGSLRIRKLPMPEATRGNLGRKRVASDTGKNPRRMHRYLTDRKVFDRTSRGMGGVVIIDASGSMSFGHNDIREIVEAAPGCTVAMYTETMYSELPNLWVLAEKGRICKRDDMPTHRAGNVVDLPALKWAVSKRQRSSAPVVWVSDGGVTGVGDSGHAALNRACAKYIRQQRIIMVPNVTKAKEVLAKLRSGATSVEVKLPYTMNV